MKASRKPVNDKVAFRVIFIYTLHNVRLIIFAIFKLNYFLFILYRKIPNSNESAMSDKYRVGNEFIDERAQYTEC